MQDKRLNIYKTLHPERYHVSEGTGQVSPGKNHINYMGVHPNTENHCARLSQIMLLDKPEAKCHEALANPNMSNPIKSFRIAIGQVSQVSFH
jgi:hypothetical protein